MEFEEKDNLIRKGKMMYNKKILASFIIPIYNTEKYLDRCLRSVCAIKNKNIEIILVDDGSTDCSLLICEKYAEMDERICIVRQENRGVSYARNSGIKRAGGEWVTFIDSDDEIVPQVYDSFLLQINRTAELWILGCTMRYMETPFSVVKDRDIVRGIWLGQDIELIRRNMLDSDLAPVRKMTRRGFNFRGPFAKFFLNQLIITKGISFPEGIVLGEDALFLFEYLQYVKSIIYTNECGYYYWQNFDSCMHRFQQGKGQQILEAVEKIRKFSEKKYLMDYWQLVVRYYLRAMKLDWCNSENPESYCVRRKEAIKWRNMSFLREAFRYFKLSRVRWEMVPLAFCAKIKWFFMCNLLLKFKEKLPFWFVKQL